MSASIDILLVEDDPGDVRLALSVLSALQMADACMVAHDGEDAIDFLRSHGRFSQRAPGLPRLILLDLKMPRMNGFDLLQEIKTDIESRLIPVVALTSSCEERDVERAYDLGVNGYVVKGIDFVDYRATLQALASYWVGVNERSAGVVARRSSATIQSTAKHRSTNYVAARDPWVWPLVRT